MPGPWTSTTRPGEPSGWEPAPLELPAPMPRQPGDDGEVAEREPERDRTGSHVVIIDLA